MRKRALFITTSFLHGLTARDDGSLWSPCFAAEPTKLLSYMIRKILFLSLFRIYLTFPPQRIRYIVFIRSRWLMTYLWMQYGWIHLYLMVLYSHNGLPPDNVDAEEISLYGNFIYYDFRSWGIRLADPHPGTTPCSWKGGYMYLCCCRCAMAG